MFGKLVLVLSVGATLLQAPIVAPAARCCSHLASPQASFSDGCCAAMACCMIARDTAAQPLTPTVASNALMALPAPTFFVSLIDLPAGLEKVHFAKARPVAHSPPPLALLCTFLI